MVGPGVRAPGGARTLRAATLVLPRRLGHGRELVVEAARAPHCRSWSSRTARSCRTPRTPTRPASGSPVNPGRMDFDLVIVGAGPAGLSAAVYGASEGFSTLVVDEGGIGGQATSSSLIRNYLGFPRGVSGRRLAQNAYEQAWVFGANFTFMQRVTDLATKATSSRWCSPTAGGRTRRCCSRPASATADWACPARSPQRRRCLLRRSRIGGAGRGGPRCVRRRRCQLGGPGRVVLPASRTRHLVVRAERSAQGCRTTSSTRSRRPRTSRCASGPRSSGGGGDGRLEHLVLRDRAEGSEEIVDADALFLMIGARPHTEWLPPTIARDEQRFRPHRPRHRPRAWPLERRTVPVRDEHARRVRRGRRASWFGEATRN